MAKVARIQIVPAQAVKPRGRVPLRAREKSSNKKAIRNKIESKTHKKLLTIKTVPSRTKGAKKETLSILNNTKTSATKAVINSKLQLALLSPYRFPIPHERLLANVARVTGVAFVFLGGVFSLLNLGATNSVISSVNNQHAEVVSTTLDVSTFTTTPTETISSISPGTLESTTPLPLTSTRPESHLTIEGLSSALTGTVPMSINVSAADEVRVFAYNITDRSYTSIGNATRIDETTWRIYWNTTTFENGDYKIKVVIKNRYGSYDNSDSTTFTVANVHYTGTTAEAGTLTPSPSPKSTDAATSTVGPTLSDATTSASIRLRLAQKPVPNEPIQFELLGTGSFADVRLYAKNTKSLVPYYVGKASVSPDRGTIIYWDIKSVTNGSYTVQAYTKSETTDTPSNVLTVVVQNILEATAAIDIATTTKTLEDIQKSQIDISLPKGNNLSGKVEIDFKATNADSIEVYVLPKTSLTPYFLGPALSTGDGSWKYMWSTMQSPNGAYQLFGKLKNSYGIVESTKVSVNVRNDVATIFTQEQEKTIDTIAEAQRQLPKKIDSTEEIETTESDQQNEAASVLVDQKTVYVEPVDSFMKTLELDDSQAEKIESMLSEFRLHLNRELNEYSKALRTNNTEEQQKIKGSIENLKSDLLQNIPESEKTDEILAKINMYVSQVTTDLQQLTADNEIILKDRIGDSIMKDSDRDGVSDYDEISLYKTNPFAADTDGDSFIDGTEISLGYNPHDSDSEALVAYESPKDTGIVRDDLLVVDSITTLTDFATADESIAAPSQKRAIISGKGLPNSFVTIYIFSTPIVVTVKTDNAGDWSYVFDKELEDGNHEVYVGITDNAGRVVAKSNPLQFVKTAEAFTESNGENKATIQTNVQPPLLNSNGLLLLVASIGIAAIGLVLILLGIHVKDTRRFSELHTANT